MKSMTAYSKIEKLEDDLNIVIEIKSYNHRHLDLSLNIPYEYIAFESQIKKIITKKILRGRVELKLFLKEKEKDFSQYQVDEEKLSKILDLYKKIEKKSGKNNLAPLSLSSLMKDFNAIGFQKEEKENNHTKEFVKIKKQIEKCLDQLNKMKEKEGNFIKKDLIQRIKNIKDAKNKISKISENSPAKYKEILKKRIDTLLNGVEANKERLEQELAFFADKIDISEELLRIESHIKHFLDIAKGKNKGQGQKLNFLMQEFNREFNTIASKSNNSDISQISIFVKAELEKIREQVQNIE